MKTRTRYAPSPTGYFHIGGARTALFNFLFAKKMKGDFILRIEDTDNERNVEGGIESQLYNLNWLDISPDESPQKEGEYKPYQQTLKLDRYKMLAETLLKEDKAYCCFCSKEELDEQRKKAEANHETPKYNKKCLSLTKNEIKEKIANKQEYVIRLKINEDEHYEWNDLVRGKISIPGSALTDPVILKSNKIAMYNFAVVVDDYDMDITHVLRGEEHISNTPYQIAIKKALGFDKKEISYGHLSIIVNDEGKKLSKRDLSLKQFIEDYRLLGYLPIAITNFLCLLGWTPSNNKEIMSLSEMINSFQLDGLTKSPAKFDVSKLNWISNQHFKSMNDKEYLEFVKPFVKSENEIYNKNPNKVLLLLKNQISYAKQINDFIVDLFENNKIDESSNEEIIGQKENIKLVAPILLKLINDIEFDNEENIKKIINNIKEQTKLNGKNLFMPIRLLSTKKQHGPDLTTTLYLFGKKRIKQNIEDILQRIK